MNTYWTVSRKYPYDCVKMNFAWASSSVDLLCSTSKFQECIWRRWEFRSVLDRFIYPSLSLRAHIAATYLPVMQTGKESNMYAKFNWPLRFVCMYILFQMWSEIKQNIFMIRKFRSFGTYLVDIWYRKIFLCGNMGRDVIKRINNQN